MKKRVLTAFFSVWVVGSLFAQSPILQSKALEKLYGEWEFVAEEFKPKGNMEFTRKGICVSKKRPEESGPFKLKPPSFLEITTEFRGEQRTVVLAFGFSDSGELLLKSEGQDQLVVLKKVR